MAIINQLYLEDPKFTFILFSILFWQLFKNANSVSVWKKKTSEDLESDRATVRKVTPF